MKLFLCYDCIFFLPDFSKKKEVRCWNCSCYYIVLLKISFGIIFSLFHVGIESVAKNVRSIYGLIWKKGRSCFFFSQANLFVQWFCEPSCYNIILQSPQWNFEIPASPLDESIWYNEWLFKTKITSWFMNFFSLLIDPWSGYVCTSLHNTSNIAIISNSFWFIIFISNYLNFLNSYRWWIKQLFDEKENTMEPKKFYSQIEMPNSTR